MHVGRLPSGGGEPAPAEDSRPTFAPASSGFTLVELLVVVAVIAVLATLLLPALSRAKDQAHRVVCLGNMRQLMLGWLLYEGDTGRLSPASAGPWSGTPDIPGWTAGWVGWNGPGEWAPMRTNTQMVISRGAGKIGPYVKAAGVFRCPADRTGIYPGYDRPPYRARSYTMNLAIGIPDTRDPEDNVSFFKMTDFWRVGPANSWVLMEESPWTIDDGMFELMWPANPGAENWSCYPSLRHRRGGTDWIRRWARGDPEVGGGVDGAGRESTVEELDLQRAGQSGFPVAARSDPHPRHNPILSCELPKSGFYESSKSDLRLFGLTELVQTMAPGGRFKPPPSSRRGSLGEFPSGWLRAYPLAMARKTTSQWDFSGELFGAGKSAPKPAREVVSVLDLTRRVRDLLEGPLGAVWVRGEVSNFRMQASGHAYFVLKDAASAMSCVLFRSQAGVSRTLLRDGASVILGGAVTVYEPRGQYQLKVTHVEAEGIGALQAAFEELKRRLAAEGLFEPSRKRPIPAFPRGIGIVTSATGAALRDVLHVIGRRFAGLEIVVAPARVQGQGAAKEIAEGIDRLNCWAAAGAPLDVILITRGGGSLEDLWAFNEEVLARAIAASALPVVSAVGHEIDFTISDFVADLRAATPSAAAEILTAGYVASRERIATLAVRFPRLVQAILADQEEGIADLQRRLARVHPRRLLEGHSQHLDELGEGLRVGVGRALHERRRSAGVLGQRLLASRPSARLGREARLQVDLRRRLVAGVHARLAGQKERLTRLGDRLRLLSPEAVLARGYSITLDAASGSVVRDAESVQPGQRLISRLAAGQVISTVVDRG